MIVLLAVVGLVVVNALEGKPMGNVHDRRNYSDRDLHGIVLAIFAAGQGARMLRHWLRTRAAEYFGGK